MKKFFLFLTANILIFYSLFFLLPKDKVFAVEYPYARINSANTAFYSQAIASKENIKFILEKSYFIKLLENEKNGFYKAEYMDQTGYVLKSELTFVKGTPTKPYASSISFRVFAFEGMNLRSSPIKSQGPFNIVTTVPFLESNLVYYGKVNGEEAVPNKGDIWYFCKYVQPNTQTVQFGYLYSIFCDTLTLIQTNTENLEVIENPIFTTPNENVNDNALSALDKNLQIIIVLGVSLPCLAIIYFLFKPTKISLDNGKKKKKIKKLKNSDYFEFED